MSGIEFVHSGNPVSSIFSWTPSSAQVGTYVVTFTATHWGKGNNFHLNNLTTAMCTLDPNVGGPNPPPAGFNKYEGTGTGTCNGLSAATKWTFTDAGEPGKNKDSMTIVITGGCSLSVSGKLAGGDHQAHNP